MSGNIDWQNGWELPVAVGITVAFVGWLGKLVVDRFPRDSKANQRTITNPVEVLIKGVEAPPEVDYHPTPTPQEINEAMGKATPYGRKHVRESFENLPVRWRGALSSISDLSFRDGETHLIQLHYGQEGYLKPTFCIRIDLEKFPFFKVLNLGDEIEVAGRIEFVVDTPHLKELSFIKRGPFEDSPSRSN
jgi:hypothetical protein